MKKNVIFKLLGLCLLINILVFEITLSRYETTFSKTDEARIAVMANDVIFSLESPKDLYPGCDAIIIPIIITNEKSGKICEVSQEFTVEIERNITNIPLEFGLYEDEDCNIEIINNNGVYNDESFKFFAGKHETKKYYLKINWPEEYNDEMYAFEVEYIKLRISVTQID